MKRIQCSNPNCDGTLAHQLGSRTIDIGRQKQQMTVNGSDYAITLTCPKCLQKSSIIVEEGKVEEADLVYKADDAPADPPAPVTDPPGDPEPEPKKFTKAA